MPRGVYVHLDDGAVERFHCAPGAGGWRYVSDIHLEGGSAGSVDLTVDSRWRQLRLEVRTGGWLVRGGVTGTEVLWARLGEHGDAAGRTQGAEQTARAAGFTGRSPAFHIAVARMLDLDPGEHARVRLVRLAEPVLAPLVVEQEWSLAEVSTHRTETEPLRVEHYRVSDLATGEGETFYLAGDVVVAAPGTDLDDLDSPPHPR